MSVFFKTRAPAIVYIALVLFSKALLLMTVAAACLYAQARPDPAAQKAAMEKFRFLTGTWTGEVTISAGPGSLRKLMQTEEVVYKLDGLALLIEGTGRDDTGKIVFSALAVVSYDEKSGTYRIRAWNEGYHVEGEIKTDGKGFEWGFTTGPAAVRHVMMLDAQGRWSERSEVTVGEGRKYEAVRMLLTRKP